MGPLVEITYYICRLAEEKYGPVAHAGDRLVYRSVSRFAWIDPIFEIEPGTVCQVLSVEHVEASGSPDYEEWDNHYHYRLRALEHHDTVVTAEVIALFELVSAPDAFLPLCAQIKWHIAQCQAFEA